MKSRNQDLQLIDVDYITGLDLRVVVPLTDASKVVRKWHVIIKPDSLNSLQKESVADVLQLKSSSTERLIRRIGRLSSTDLARVKVQVIWALELA